MAIYNFLNIALFIFLTNFSCLNEFVICRKSPELWDYNLNYATSITNIYLKQRIKKENKNRVLVRLSLVSLNTFNYI